MNVMHSQVNRVTFSDRVIPEIQNLIGNLSLSQKDAEVGTSSDKQGIGNKSSGLLQN